MKPALASVHNPLINGQELFSRDAMEVVEALLGAIVKNNACHRDTCLDLGHLQLTYRHANQRFGLVLVTNPGIDPPDDIAPPERAQRHQVNQDERQSLAVMALLQHFADTGEPIEIILSLGTDDGADFHLVIWERGNHLIGYRLEVHYRLVWAKLLP